MPESAARAAVRRQLSYVESLGDVLSVWEIDFVDDLGLRVADASWEPTEKQLEKLNEIVERY